MDLKCIQLNLRGLLLQVFLLGILHYVNGDVYVDYTYPYKQGEFQTSTRMFTPLLPSLDGPPMHNKAYYPEAEGEFAVFYYLTGFGGVLPTAFYDDILHMIASHGYIAIGTWPLVSEGFPRFNAEAHLENIKWLKQNVEDKLGKAKPSFDHLTLSCHSAGCGPVLNMARQSPTVAKAIVNLEPVADAIQGGVNFTLPVLNLGAELANMSCSYPGVDFEAYHSAWTCPKIMVEVDSVGHCDFLDELAWLSCKALNFCVIGDKEIVNPYRKLIQGMASAFMTAYVQGNMDQLKYITDESLIPMVMKQHDVKLHC